ncbi:hypothetical protein OF83DRAFT_840384 [Amylostereum chailletii]|nr:hypothetical protein OF83DRAFT_840384 [Amylostereum chailletii]
MGCSPILQCDVASHPGYNALSLRVHCGQLLYICCSHTSAARSSSATDLDTKTFSATRDKTPPPPLPSRRGSVRRRVSGSRTVHDHDVLFLQRGGYDVSNTRMAFRFSYKCPCMVHLEKHLFSGLLFSLQSYPFFYSMCLFLINTTKYACGCSDVARPVKHVSCSGGTNCRGAANHPHPMSQCGGVCKQLVPSRHNHKDLEMLATQLGRGRRLLSLTLSVAAARYLPYIPR